MPKTSKRSRRTVHGDKSATTDIVTQFECAVRRPQATLIGALVGGVVPWFARTLAHQEVPSAIAAGHGALAALMIAVVGGCAIFSGLTVYKFGRATFNDARKALGFVLAIEGVMLVSQGATSAVALAVLIAINALGNGASIALAREATCKRREADARRAATRARGRQPAQSPAAPAQAAPAPRAKQSPIEVVEMPPAPGLVRVPRSWSTAADDTVIDAEIVSEESYS